MPKRTVQLSIAGKVQGVFYRASFGDVARKLGLTGWVRNRLDGSVEAVVQGEADAIAAITEWARRGPPSARVESLESADVEDSEIFSNFEKRPTE